MTRSLWAALLIGGAGWSAYAQDTFEPSTSDPPAADLGREPADAGVESGETGVEPADPGFDPGATGVEPADPGFDVTDPSDVDPATDPAGDVDAVRPGEPLEGAEPLEPGLPGSPLDAGARDGDLPDPETLPDTILDATPVPENDLPPSEVDSLPATDVQNADGLGTPLINEGRVPGEFIPGREVPPVGTDPRLPIERQPLPADADLSEPLVPNADAFPPAARRRPVIDPAYGAPAPPRPTPQIEIGDVVRNPIRVYETRLLVLMGHGPAEEAIDTLAQRFPTDARVPYLRFFHLSRRGQRDAALNALQQAVAMERLYPVTDYNRFMEPLQGPDRYYAERVRRATAELAAADGLVEPLPEDVITEDEDRPEPAGTARGTAPGPAPIDPNAAEPPFQRDPLDDHLPDGPSEPIDPQPGLEDDTVLPEEDVPNG